MKNMPCYVTYKIRTQIKAEDVELFKLIAKEKGLTYRLEKVPSAFGGMSYNIVTSQGTNINGAMEELTARKMVKEAKKRNWKIKEVNKAKVKA